MQQQRQQQQHGLDDWNFRSSSRRRRILGSSSTSLRLTTAASLENENDDGPNEVIIDFQDGDDGNTIEVGELSPSKSTRPVRMSLLGEISLQQHHDDDDDDMDDDEDRNTSTVDEQQQQKQKNLEDPVGRREGHLWKNQWKKKSYLMMQDVKDEIRLRPKHAPRKAEEMVRRLRTISERHQQELLQQQEFFRDDGNSNGNEKEEVDDSELLYEKQTIGKAYNLWIHALARSGWEDAGYLAEDVLEEMRFYHIPPNVITYSSVMDAHARSPSRDGVGGGAKAAQDFLFDVVSREAGGGAEGNVNMMMVDTILNALTQEGSIDSAEQAELILHRLEALQNEARCSSRSNNSKKNARVVVGPTVVSYATVMNAWAKVGSAEAAERAEKLLERMLKRALEHRTDARREGIPNSKRKKTTNIEDETAAVRPDTVVFNAAINCWATSKDSRAGKKSLQLLEKMKKLASTDNDNDDEDRFDVHPDIVTYNTVLSAWSHCGDENAAPQAERIVKDLQREQEEYQRTQSDPESIARTNSGRPPVVPNTVSYNIILDAWSKSKLSCGVSRAQKVLDYMIQSGIPDIAPDVYSFTSVMDAWAKSKEAHKGLRARELLDRLNDLYYTTKRTNLRPTQIPYNTVLNACAFSARGTSEEEQREALKIAVGTFASMSTSSTMTTRSNSDTSYKVRRDTVSYGNMLKCIANLIPHGDVRNRMALQVFRHCCEEGLVGSLVWNEIRRAVPTKVLQDACGADLFDRSRRNHGLQHGVNGIGSIDVHQLPKHWTANNRFDKLLHTGSPTQQKQPRPRQLDEQESKNTKYKTTTPQPKDRRKNMSSPSQSSPTGKPSQPFLIESSFASGRDM